MRSEASAKPATPVALSAEACWAAVLARDRSADGRFVYAVRTTGVYCRPWCGARRPRRENVRFHATPADAERAGYRACKRCRPAAAAADAGHARAVERACRSIESAEAAPGLETLAAAGGLSAPHFRRVFRHHTGVTPKAYAAAQRAKRLRGQLSRGRSVTSAVHAAGFPSAGRFYAAADAMLGMTAGAYRAGGAGVTIRFAVGGCSLGAILVAASERGVCAIALGDEPGALVRDLEDRFHSAALVGDDAAFAETVARVVAFVDRPSLGLDLPLDIRGTAFQQRVWRHLRGIPCGQRQTYSEIAHALGVPRAVRAVAGACAANTLAVAIPCHRVVRTDGSLSGYRWGVERKARLLAAERAGEA